MNMNSIILSIDGNIGSGKSTLYNNLKNHYKDRDDICFVPEPVDSWHDIQDSDGTPILTNLYKDTKRYAFRFQMMAYISRLHLLKEAIKKNKYRIIFTERCVQTDRNVFAKMLYDDGNIEEDEYHIYNKWFDEFLHEIKIEGIIYVKADPKTCLDRVNSRAREGENIPIEYLQKCHEYHENWLSTISNILTIDANSNIDDDSETRKIWINRIDEWINKNQYIMRFDGACRGNPSNELGLGCIIYKNDAICGLNSKKITMTKGTNNRAEYLACIEGLKLCINNNIKNVLVQGDSELVINQVNNIYKVNDTVLQIYYKEINKLKGNFTNITFQHIRREFNKEADELANNALDELHEKSIFISQDNTECI